MATQKSSVLHNPYGPKYASCFTIVDYRPYLFLGSKTPNTQNTQTLRLINQNKFHFITISFSFF